MEKVIRLSESGRVMVLLGSRLIEMTLIGDESRTMSEAAIIERAKRAETIGR